MNSSYDNKSFSNSNSNNDTCNTWNDDYSNSDDINYIFHYHHDRLPVIRLDRCTSTTLSSSLPQQPCNNDTSNDNYENDHHRTKRIVSSIEFERILQQYVLDYDDDSDDMIDGATATHCDVILKRRKQQLLKQRPPILHPPCPDISWLCCQQPQRHYNIGNDDKLPSITGIFELDETADKDSHNDSENAHNHDENILDSNANNIIHIELWTSSIVESSSNNSNHTNGISDNANSSNRNDTNTTNNDGIQFDMKIKTNPPSWKRQSLHYIPPSLVVESSSSAAATTLSEESRNQPPTENIRWIDLRNVTSSSISPCDDNNNNTDWLPTNASCVYFLQSILEENADVSPWRIGRRQQHPIQNNDATATSTIDFVFVMVTGSAPELLLNFRVSDICPSWYLYSSTLLNIPTNCNNCNMLWYPWNNHKFHSNGGYEIVELLVFHKLPPRERLSSIHPMTYELVPIPGCLWETIVRLKPDDCSSCHANNDDDANHDNATAKHLSSSPPPPPPVIVTYQVSSPPFIDYESEYRCNNNTERMRATTNNIRELLKPCNLAIIQEEVSKIPQWTAWPEQQHYTSTATNALDDTDSTNISNNSAPWNVFPLCYCFPANVVSQRKWVQVTSSYVPKTVALIQQYCDDGANCSVRTALFSKLNPNTVLHAHTGWEDLANHVYRVHIPIVVPTDNDNRLCGVWVDGCTIPTTREDIIVFDDSKTHRAYNYSPTEERIVLIIDLIRPDHLPPGTAIGGHSTELDDFIQQYDTVS